MNKIYRLVWSKIKEKWIVASEKVACGCRPSSVVGALTLAAFLAIAGPSFSLDPNALPTGGKITAGSGNIAASGNKMTVNQSTQQMIANWDTFNIGQNATVRFNQPNSSATALNRIYDQNPSQIFGNLSANGKIFLVNPSGIVFGANARVDVGGLVASSLNILDSDYLAGKFKFTNSGTAGNILNQGTINTMPGGVVALIAPRVVNNGTITANSGSVLFAAANQVSLDFKGDGLINYTISQGAVDALAANKGLIKADGALVVMTAKAADSLTRAVVNNTGVIEAQTLQNKGGRILLLSDMENGDAIIGGTLDASAPNGGDGGFVETSGGRVKIGDGTKVTTSAPQGKTGMWLIDPTDFTIATTGGDMTGATLSSNLISGDIEIKSSDGASGTDGNINVNDAVSWTINKLTLTATNDININSVMTAAGSASLDLAPASNKVNVALGSSGFTGRLDWNSTGVLRMNVSNTLQPFIVINNVTDLQNINSTGLAGYYALGSSFDASSIANFVPIGDNITSFTGVFDGLGHTINDLYINRNENYQGLLGRTNSATIRNVGLINADISSNNYVGGLIGYNNGGTISNSYATGEVQGNDNVGGLVGVNSGGSIENSYATGLVTGSGDNVGGLAGRNFASVTEKNSSATASINSSYATGQVTGGDNVGGLIGWNYASTTDRGSSATDSIRDSYATGEVTGNDNVGGLVGKNSATGIFSDATTATSINNSYSTGQVTGGDNVGGLVGWHYASGWGTASITSTYATGAVHGYGSYGYVGGLVGANYGTITNSYATGAAQGNNNIGGLVGKNYYGNISNAYAIGAVEGNSYVGGLVGYNYYGTISNTCAHGTVTGTSTLTLDSEVNVATSFGNTAEIEIVIQNGLNVGGLVGSNSGTIENSYATGAVSGNGTVNVTLDVNGNVEGQSTVNVTIQNGYAGGLVGSNSGTIGNSYATGTVAANGTVDVTDNTDDVTVAGAGNFTSNISIQNGYIGGLVGSNSGTIGNSYATGAITSTGAVNLAFTPPTAVIQNGYIGGLVGFNSDDTFSNVTNSFWDEDTSGLSTSAGGTGKTTTEMHTLATFADAGWDIDAAGNTGKVWRIYEGYSYPLLRNFLKPATATVAGIATPKVYDGTIAAGGGTLSYTWDTPAPSDMTKIIVGPLGPYTTTDKNVGDNKQVILGGLYSVQDGYDIKTLSTATADITAKGVTISGMVANDKVYNGNTLATLSNSGTVTTDVGTETLVLNSPEAANITFNTKNVLTADTVTGTGYSLSDGTNGGLASNYALTSTTATDGAHITAKGITGTAIAASSSIYASDLNPGAVSFGNIVSGDMVTSTATVNTSTTSTSGKPIVGTYTQTAGAIGGDDKDNYSFAGFTTETNNYTINKLALTGPAIAASSSIYASDLNPGALSFTNIVSGDMVTSTATVNTSTTSTSGKPIVGTYTQTAGDISGDDNANYSFSGYTTPSANYTINKLALTGDITADNKVYDGNNGATIVTRTLTGAIIGDIVSYIGGSATFSDKNVANGKTVTGIDLSLDGTDAGNYTVNSTATTTANITANITALTTASIFPEIPLQVPPIPPPAKGPSYAPPPPVFDPGDPYAGIVVTVASQPLPGTAGVIIVTIPAKLAGPGAGFNFPLPEQVASAAQAAAIIEKITLPDGSALPSWLQYDPDSRTFVARNVPEGFLAITVVVTVGNQSWTVKITKQ
jgi:filamentous hemagglutinin family protein